MCTWGAAREMLAVVAAPGFGVGEGGVGAGDAGEARGGVRVVPVAVGVVGFGEFVETSGGVRGGTEGGGERERNFLISMAEAVGGRERVS